jgi:hypothetical protein
MTSDMHAIEQLELENAKLRALLAYRTVQVEVLREQRVRSPGDLRLILRREEASSGGRTDGTDGMVL